MIDRIDLGAEGGLRVLCGGMGWRVWMVWTLVGCWDNGKWWLKTRTDREEEDFIYEG